MLLTELLHNVKIEKEELAEGVEISGVADDSRRVLPGNLFVAVPGTKVDATQFVVSAVKRGAAAVVLEKEAEVPSPAVKIIVKNARQALAQIAANFFGNPSRHLTLIGVTGTNGKTTVTYLIESILKEAGYKTGVIGTIAARRDDKIIAEGLTTPPPLELQQILKTMQADGITHVVIEASSHALDQERLQGVDFDVAVFTNLTPEHLDYHKTMEEYLKAKRKLFEGLDCGEKAKVFAVINADDQYARSVLGRFGGRVFTYSIEKPSNLKAMKVSMKEGCPAFSADGCAINGRLLGVYNVYNYLAAMQVGLILGIERDKIQVALEKIARVPGRMEEIKSGQPYRVLVDFAHTPDALHKAIRAARALSKGSRLLVVFGCPGDRDRTKRPVMGKIAAEEADIVIVTTDDPHSEDPAEIIKEIVAGVPLEEKVDVANVLGESKKHSGALDAKTYAIVDRRAAIETALSLAKPGEVVLLAGRGHEKFQDFNGRKIPLDDRAVVIELLGNLPR